jgi:DnaJ-class molecular chaperone
MDHYTTLGVDKNAGSDDIKRAYRKLASQHHPDKGGDKAKFQEIQAAYDTLSNPDKRAQYDNPQPQFHGGGGFNGAPPGFEDIFAQMFGGGQHPFGNMFRQQQAPRNRTLNIQTSITLEDAFHGKDLIATLGLPSGRDQTIEVKIPAGIGDGTTLRLAGMGDDSVPNAPRGDIHLTVNITPHHRFQRQGDDLLCVADVSCIDAMLGKSIFIDTIDGKTLETTIQPGTQHGQMLAATGYGMPKMGDNRYKGRLIINVNVTIPNNLTNEQRTKLREIFH